MGKPVAFDASAELRETRGFISMTTIRPVPGCTANWMFDPPVSTPMARMIATAASRIAWYSLSVSVCAGATVIESPVCTPIGSKFSIEHTITTLSLPSRMTSSSNSFHPAIDSSISTSLIGDASRPQATVAWNSSGVVANPPPVPPSVRDGRTITGSPSSARNASASASVWTTPLRGRSRPMERIGPLGGDDPLEHGHGERLDVRAVGELGIGHDRRRVRVDEDDAVALLAQRLARLRPRVVELARLADHDRPRADEQDRVEIGAPGHRLRLQPVCAPPHRPRSISSTKRRKR